MPRMIKIAALALGAVFFFQPFWGDELQALPIVESKSFTADSHSFLMEIHVSGGHYKKKRPLMLSSLKLKIRNERTPAGVGDLVVKAIRAYSDPAVLTDIETRGFSIAPGKWVTKFYLLPKKRRIVIGEQGFIEVTFENFIIRFSPKERKFQGPIQ